MKLMLISRRKGKSTIKISITPVIADGRNKMSRIIFQSIFSFVFESIFFFVNVFEMRIAMVDRIKDAMRIKRFLFT